MLECAQYKVLEDMICQGWSGRTQVGSTEPWPQPHWTPLGWTGTPTSVPVHTNALVVECKNSHSYTPKFYNGFRNNSMTTTNKKTNRKSITYVCPRHLIVATKLICFKVMTPTNNYHLLNLLKSLSRICKYLFLTDLLVLREISMNWGSYTCVTAVDWLLSN